MLKSIIDWAAHQNPEFVKAWGPVAVGMGTMIVGLLALLVSLAVNVILLFFQRGQNKRQNNFSLRQLALSKSKDQRDAILHQLNEFFGPFIQLRTQSKLLYEKFGYELEKKHRTISKPFRTLRYLLEGETFTSQERALLEQILELNEKLMDLIESSLGVVDKLELQDLLGKFGSHVRVLRLAYQRKLKENPGLFEDIVFPLAIDGAIESEIQRLKSRLSELNVMIEDRQPNGTKPLKTKTRDATIRYYDEHADSYANKTQYLDLSELYKPFRTMVRKWGRILDAGCGVGRDTRYFIEHGYTVVSFDASRGMVDKCEEYPHAFCLNMSFDDVAFREEFDGVWCCASLIHVGTPMAVDAVKRLTTALKSGGIMFLSIKMGSGSETSGGRFFQYYDELTVRQLYENEHRLEVSQVWKNKSVDPSDPQQREWLNLLLRRRPAPV
jgi:SAM-dependent methyltransferase